MDMPVTVGVILIIAFLIGFSEWFYGVVEGIGATVVNDSLHSVRVLGMALFSIVFMVGVFYAISIVNECPNENREGLFAGIRCEEYLAIKSTANELLDANH